MSQDENRISDLIDGGLIKEKESIKIIFDLHLKSLDWDKNNPIQKAMYLRLLDATEFILKKTSSLKNVHLICEHCKSKSVTIGDGGLWCNDCRKLTKKESLCDCGNHVFTHRHSNWIECTKCNKIKILDK